MIIRLITITFVLTYLTCPAVRAQESQDLRPGVVRIYNAAREEQGTGFIVRIRGSKAYVVSAAHVVEGGRDHEVYLFNQPDEPLRGRVIDMEAGEPFGLALLEINVDEGLIPGLKEIELRSASGLRGGESVQVIGFPARTRQWTVLPAAVARIEGRKIVFVGNIQGGNSGGPVLLNGKVVGVVVEQNESESLSYAAQADSVVQYVNGIEERLFSAVDSAVREADRGAIYITRIINPPRGDGPQKSTVWLAASGRQTFIVDSITIEHDAPRCAAGQSGARPPDANYTFSFDYGSQKTHTLNPALALDPKDPREVSFTLGLGPKGKGPENFFPSSCGDVSAQIHYHTAEGRRGTLLLEEPPQAGGQLAKLLGADVKFGPFIISPRGFQRGQDEIKPTDDLAAYILGSDILKVDWITLWEAGAALAIYPTGEWVRALLALARKDSGHISRLFYLTRNRLAEAERKLAEEICLKQLDAPLPKEAAMKYLLWRGHRKSILEEKLRSLPPALLNDPNATEYMDHRKRIRKALFGDGDEERKAPR